MTKEQAHQKGYEYTGHYDRNKDASKIKLQQLRKLGYSAVMVTEPINPLSKGYGGPGYSIYVEPKYRLDNEAKAARDRLETHDQRVADLQRKHQIALDFMEKEKAALLEWLKTKGYKL